MKKLFVVFAAVISCAACNGPRESQASAIGLLPLENYLIKNDVVLPEVYNYRVITDKTEFDRLAAPATTMDQPVRQPDFSGQTVVAVISRPDTLQQQIVFERAMAGGNDIHVYYRIDRRIPQSFASASMAMATIPKVFAARQVHFYEANVLVKTVPVTRP